MQERMQGTRSTATGAMQARKAEKCTLRQIPALTGSAEKKDRQSR